MEKQRENEVTCYKITHNNCLSPSQEAFEIEISSMAREITFPVHEEYKLLAARSEFILDTNEFCNKYLEDLKASKRNNLQKLKQSKLFLKESQRAVGILKSRHKAFAERSYRFLAESRHQLEILYKDSHIIDKEVNESRIKLNKLIRTMNK